MTATTIPRHPVARPATPTFDLDAALSTLNDAQRQAVTAPVGPVIVAAGPGAGKTRVLTLRIAYLIAHGADPGSVVAVTFTNKAAREMKQRLVGLIGQDAVDQLAIGTFHSLCARWLRKYSHALRREPNFTIFDEDDQKKLWKQILADKTVEQALLALEVSPKEIDCGQVMHMISGAKARLVGAQQLAEQVGPSPDTMTQTVVVLFRAYQEALRAANAFDFDDLLLGMAWILQNNRLVQEKFHTAYEHVLVDETQDSNVAQLQLLYLLTLRSKSLFAVGDRAQSLYSWRGAAPTVFEQLIDHYGQDATRVIKLEQNYRSTPTICAAAQALIDASTEQSQFTTRIWTARQGGSPVRIAHFESDYDEAKAIGNAITRLKRKGQRYGDIAIALRTNGQTRLIEDALVRRAIPYQIVGGTQFYERSEIRDVLAVLRVLHNGQDTVAVNRMLNTPRRGLGEKAQAMLLQDARDRGLVVYDRLLELATGERAAHIAATVPVNHPERAPTIRRWAQRFLAPMGTSGGDASRKAWAKALAVPSTLATAKAQSGIIAYVLAVEELRALAEQQPLKKLIPAIVQRLDYEAYLHKEYGDDKAGDKLENISQLAAIADRWGSARAIDDIGALLEEVALLTDAADARSFEADELPDDLDQLRDNRVTLLTTYKAKGLEWPTVFVAGLVESILPHQRTLETRNEALLEEERRVCYVALTRAKDELYVSSWGIRTAFGEGKSCKPSRFLNDMPTKQWQRWG